MQEDLTEDLSHVTTLATRFVSESDEGGWKTLERGKHTIRPLSQTVRFNMMAYIVLNN